MVEKILAWIQANSATIKDIAISVSQGVIFAMTLFISVKAKYKEMQNSDIKAESDSEMKKCQEDMLKQNKVMLDNYMREYKAESEKTVRILQARQEKLAIDTKKQIDANSIKINQELQTLYKIKGESADEDIAV